MKDLMDHYGNTVAYILGANAVIVLIGQCIMAYSNILNTVMNSCLG